MIKIENVSKNYGDFNAIHNLNMNVRKGSIHGLIGENGSGKTTIIKCIMGIYKVNEGKIIVDGEEVYENPKIKARMGYVADNNEFFPGYRLGKLMKFYKGVYQTFDEEKFIELNGIFRLDMNKRVNELSKGQKMRLAYMLNLSIRPDVLIMDEPTSGLDAMAKKELFDSLVNEVEEREMTVIISSHNLADLERICDNITIIKNGTNTGKEDMDEVMKMARKFQFAFENGTPDGFMSQSKMISVKNVGNIYTVVYHGITEEEVEELNRFHPVYMEEVNVSLEEVFVYTNGGEGYDGKATT